MKIDELQIGDWVMLNPDLKNLYSFAGEPRRVIGLYDSDGAVKIEDDKGNFFWTDAYEDIEPIPLTEAILEKNGFENMGNCYGELKIGEYRIMCDARNIAILHNEHVDVDVPVEFVHELQNVLSICRIEKKIEL